MPYNIPVLILIFNRKEKTQKVLDRLREIKPKYLFVSGDGPRGNVKGDEGKCINTRKLFESIDWDCEVHTCYNEKNLGCRNAVYKGISWFFSQVEFGIILEDDCVPHKSFFPYCEELLEKYKNDKSISHITGYNPLGEVEINESYFFSKHVLVWGWASWRRAWEIMDLEMKTLNQFLDTGRIEEFTNNKSAQNYIIDKWYAAQKQELNSWAYPWAFSSIQNNCVAIIPKYNLIENIGFDQEATNTKAGEGAKINRILSFPLKHPKERKIIEKRELDVFYKSQKDKKRLMLWDSFIFKLFFGRKRHRR